MKLPGVVIETFLRNHPDAFCTDCLSRKLDVPAGQVSMVVRRLQESGGFSARYGVCAQCRGERMTIKAVTLG